MSLFPNEFPFNRPEIEPGAEPISQVQPPAITEEQDVAPADVGPALQILATAPASVPNPVHERRKSPRQTIVARAMIRHDAVRGPSKPVQMTNLSLLGVQFRTNDLFDRDEKATIRLEVGPLRWNSPLRVVHCEKKEDGSYTVGAAFIGNELNRTKPIIQAA
ncbi:MAG TPA: PilZ domain-containing protein [Tepidisphaeraceae bacterium]|nr:PilZ domain-containing protein [Tepidisphaeraceae bacterium]